eukprot:m.280529 g.280529  ORF g.280529 m.280529 type:complete len:485 (+) comp19826_c0_seq5:164-1618(+)
MKESITQMPLARLRVMALAGVLSWAVGRKCIVFVEVLNQNSTMSTAVCCLGAAFFILAASKMYSSHTDRAQTLLTSSYLSTLLTERSTGEIKVKKVCIPHIAQCGDGKASTTDRISLLLEYENSSLSCEPCTPPRRMIAKCILLPWYLRLGATPRVIALVGKIARVLAVVGLDRVLYFGINLYNVYFPHAPDAMYENEAKFYKYVSSELHIEVPEVFGVMHDDSKCLYGILMEDLRIRRASFPTAVDSLPVETVQRLLTTTLAQLHSKFWNSERLDDSCGDLGWLPTPVKGGMHEVFCSVGEGLIADHLRRNTFERELIAPLNLTVAQLWQGLQIAEEELNQAPRTVCHGDCHVQNTYVLGDGTVGLFDFQLALRANWARDVAYIIGTALTIEDRRRHEKRLLEAYLAELTRLGVSDVPSFDDAFSTYRKAMAWGLVIGWLLCPVNNYGPAILAANVRKLVAACVDLGTFPLLFAAGGVVPAHE